MLARNTVSGAALPVLSPSIVSAPGESSRGPFDQVKDEYTEKISPRRMVTVHNVAAMTLFLASPAGQTISGQAISVDGNVEYL
jgi:enoyl-[acyl-carrier-protein] reductase (NADH)